MWYRITLSGPASHTASLYNDVIRACDVQLHEEFIWASRYAEALRNIGVKPRLDERRIEIYGRWRSDGSEHLWLNDEALRLYRDTGGSRQVDHSSGDLMLLAGVGADELLGTRVLSFRAARVSVTMAMAAAGE